MSIFPFFKPFLIESTASFNLSSARYKFPSKTYDLPSLESFAACSRTGIALSISCAILHESARSFRFFSLLRTTGPVFSTLVSFPVFLSTTVSVYVTIFFWPETKTCAAQYGFWFNNNNWANAKYSDSLSKKSLACAAFNVIM